MNIEIKRKEEPTLIVGKYVVIDDGVLCQVVQDSVDMYCLIEIKTGEIFDEVAYEENLADLDEWLRCNGYTVKFVDDINITVQI